MDMEIDDVKQVNQIAAASFSKMSKSKSNSKSNKSTTNLGKGVKKQVRKSELAQVPRTVAPPAVPPAVVRLSAAQPKVQKQELGEAQTVQDPSTAAMNTIRQLAYARKEYKLRADMAML